MVVSRLDVRSIDGFRATVMTKRQVDLLRVQGKWCNQRPSEGTSDPEKQEVSNVDESRTSSIFNQQK